MINEYQFKIPNGVWLDVHADTEEEAVETLNAALHLLDEPLPAPGLIQRIQVDTREPVLLENIVSVYDMDTGESYAPSAQSGLSETNERMGIASTALLANLWRGQANSIMSQLDFVNVYPDAPMREVRTLRKCATQLEAAAKPSGLGAVIHMANAQAQL